MNTLSLALAGGGRIVVGIPMMGTVYQGNADPNAPAPPQGHIGQQPNGLPGAHPGAGAVPPGGIPLPGGPPVPGVPVMAVNGGPHAGLANGMPGGAPVAQLDLPEALNLRRLCLKDQSMSQMWVPLLEAARKVETLILARNLGSWDPVLTASLGAGRMPELTQVLM